MDYNSFLEQKKQLNGNFGFEYNFMPNELFDFQKHLIDWALKKGKSAIFADTGLGKEQPYSEPVLTPQGFKKMGDLELGDYVIAKNGQPTRIIGIYEQGIKDVYKVTFQDGTSTRCGLEHLWSVRDRNRKKRKQPFQVKSLKEIIKDYVKDRIDKRYPGKVYKDYKYHIPINDAVEFICKEKLNLDPYLLGLLIGDGGMSQEQIFFTNSNKEIVDRLIEKLPNSDKLSEVRDITYSVIRKEYNNKPTETKKQIKELGLMGKLSKEKFIPKQYLMASIENRKMLLQGLLDTDGHIVTEGFNEYSTSSKRLMKDISFLARSLGYSVRTQERDSHYTKNGEKHTGFKNWRVYIFNEKSSKLKTITNIEKIGKENSRCIMVEDKEHLYLTNDFIVTHNTFMQLVWAENVIRHTNGKVLLLTPLAVSSQTEREAEKFGIEAKKSRNGEVRNNITITNYQQLDKFNPEDYVGIVCDESSILKGFTGQFRKDFTRFSNKMKYRLLATATPSPNDFVELGTSSEALGDLKYMDMLSQFFRDTSNDKNPQWSTPKYILKGHAEQNFWRWVVSWARAIKKPSDLGFSDDRYILPKLIETEHLLKVTKPLPGRLFAEKARTLTQQRQERKMTIEERAMKTLDIVNQHDMSIIWGQYNYETDFLEKFIPDAVQISGKDNDDSKEEKFEAFSKGEIKRLITKPKISSQGLNWQHCNHMVFYPSHSYEQYYQGVRRCWRFGQKEDVHVDVVSTDGEAGIMRNIQRKAKDAETMFSNLVKHMNNELKIENLEKTKTIKKMPSWL